MIRGVVRHTPAERLADHLAIDRDLRRVIRGDDIRSEMPLAFDGGNEARRLGTVESKVGSAGTGGHLAVEPCDAAIGSVKRFRSEKAIAVDKVIEGS